MASRVLKSFAGVLTEFVSRWDRFSLEHAHQEVAAAWAQIEALQLSLAEPLSFSEADRKLIQNPKAEKAELLDELGCLKGYVD